ncbi:MAG: MlrC C-terminal domain-containing protein, partial [Trueperaceae bacterium]
ALDPRFEPLEVRARVRLLADGNLLSESHDSPWYAGPTAVLEVENITLVVTSRPVSLYDRTLFLATGQNPERFDLVVVKSPHCQHRFYEAWAERLIIVDTPGATSADLKSLGHTVCRRPVFPLDADVSYEPKALIYKI